MQSNPLFPEEDFEVNFWNHIYFQNENGKKYIYK